MARQPGLGQAILADLRAVPLTPRSVDVVHCCRLLDRISHTEILLSRLVDALRPGGLLLVRTADRQTAAGFLDRTLPRPLRALAWRRLRPGQPGPYPAVYEPLTSARGLQAFATRHGLVVSGRETTSRLAGQRRPVIAASRALVSALSRGRLTAAHDELGYVIRKPEDRFARVLSPGAAVPRCRVVSQSAVMARGQVRRGIPERDNVPSGRGGGRRMDVTARAQADSQPSQASDCAAQPAGRIGPGADEPADLTALPSLTLSETQLADLELLLSGAFAPLTGFMTTADVAAVADSWQLADGTPFPVPVTLDVPAGRGPRAAPPASRWPTPRAPRWPCCRSPSAPRSTDAGLVRLAGPVTANRVPEHGPFRRLMLTPAEAKAQAPDGPVLAWAGRGAAEQPPDRPAPAHGRPAQGPAARPAPGGRPGRGGDQARGADPGHAGRRGQPAPGHQGHPGPAGAARAPGRRRHRRPGPRAGHPGPDRRRLRRHPPDGRLRRAHRPVPGRRRVSAAGRADPGPARRRLGLRPARRGLAPAGPDRGRDRAGGPVRRPARRPARRRGAGARVVHPARGRPRAATGAAAPRPSAGSCCS